MSYLLSRNKLSVKGPAALSDIELLEAIIGNCGKDNESKQVAKGLLAVMHKVGFDELTIDDVMTMKGIGDSKASIICASMEFFRRRFVKQTAPLIDSAEKAIEQFEFIRYKRQECLVMLTLDGARRLIARRLITIGTLSSTFVHPREVFAPAIEDRAASIIIGHNHPSGALDVSEQDLEVTKRIKMAGELLGIKLDDHIVVAGDDYTSAYYQA